MQRFGEAYRRSPNVLISNQSADDSKSLNMRNRKRSPALARHVQMMHAQQDNACFHASITCAVLRSDRHVKGPFIRPSGPLPDTAVACRSCHSSRVTADIICRRDLFVYSCIYQSHFRPPSRAAGSTPRAHFIDTPTMLIRRGLSQLLSCRMGIILCDTSRVCSLYTAERQLRHLSFFAFIAKIATGCPTPVVQSKEFKRHDRRTPHGVAARVQVSGIQVDGTSPTGTWQTPYRTGQTYLQAERRPSRMEVHRPRRAWLHTVVTRHLRALTAGSHHLTSPDSSVRPFTCIASFTTSDRRRSTSERFLKLTTIHTLRVPSKCAATRLCKPASQLININGDVFRPSIVV
ncbi:hypothetical protein BIW11_03062 [Tropilaelaps mercedesae]|uniref:Uncharacterized protein n=1 Tax=Tropilaelaps mercedesae TaxID=418985 RepID=A0A1V9XSP1_9ACAR|nr:hypothetical protein BIW11_03062 [Tropilaelaps mercedesae]